MSIYTNADQKKRRKYIYHVAKPSSSFSCYSNRFSSYRMSIKTFSSQANMLFAQPLHYKIIFFNWFYLIVFFSHIALLRPKMPIRPTIYPLLKK